MFYWRGNFADSKREFTVSGFFGLNGINVSKFLNFVTSLNNVCIKYFLNGNFKCIKSWFIYKFYNGVGRKRKCSARSQLCKMCTLSRYIWRSISTSLWPCVCWLLIMYLLVHFSDFCPVRWLRSPIGENNGEVTQASSGRGCPLCRQRHLSNMF